MTQQQKRQSEKNSGEKQQRFAENIYCNRHHSRVLNKLLDNDLCSTSKLNKLVIVGNNITLTSEITFNYSLAFCKLYTVLVEVLQGLRAFPIENERCKNKKSRNNAADATMI